MLITKAEENRKKKTDNIGDDKFDIKTGDTIKVYQIIREKAKKKKGVKGEYKERIQIFEGLILAKKHGNEIGATITVRKIIAGIGVEKIFPIHSPKIQKIEIVKRSKVRRAKLYYLRTAKGRKARLKKIEVNPLPKEKENEVSTTPVKTEKIEETTTSKIDQNQ